MEWERSEQSFVFLGKTSGELRDGGEQTSHRSPSLPVKTLGLLWVSFKTRPAQPLQSSSTLLLLWALNRWRCPCLLQLCTAWRGSASEHVRERLPIWCVLSECVCVSSCSFSLHGVCAGGQSLLVLAVMFACPSLQARVWLGGWRQHLLPNDLAAARITFLVRKMGGK